MQGERYMAFGVIIVTSVAAPAVSPPEDPAAPKPTLAVLDLRIGDNVPPNGGVTLATYVRGEIRRADLFDVMDRDIMRQRLAEKDFASTGECDEKVCLVRYGKTLAVQKMVGGYVSAFGKSWTLQLMLVDVDTGRVEKTVQKEYQGEMEKLLDLAPQAALDLLGLAPAAASSSTPGGSDTNAAKKPSEPSRANELSNSDLPKTLTLDCGSGVMMELILIPAGEFTMGSPENEEGRDSDEGPQHEVSISKPFYMGKCEVRQDQWQEVMGNNPSDFKGYNLPVEQVSWEECREFCRKLSGKTGRAVRLPSVAEWEYACRAGTRSPFSFGATISTDQANYDGLYGEYVYGRGSRGKYRQKTTLAGSFPSNAWGLHDMHGNIWEWCEDAYHQTYAGAPFDGGAWIAGGYKDWRVLRGGCWRRNPKECRSANRHGVTPDVRHDYIGFRVVVEPATN